MFFVIENVEVVPFASIAVIVNILNRTYIYYINK